MFDTASLNRFKECIKNSILNKKSFCCDTTLAVILKTSHDSSFSRFFQICTFKYDIWITSSQLEDRFFSISTCQFSYLITGIITSCEGYSTDCRMTDNRFSLFVINE